MNRTIEWYFQTRLIWGNISRVATHAFPCQYSMFVIRVKVQYIGTSHYSNIMNTIGAKPSAL